MANATVDRATEYTFPALYRGQRSAKAPAATKVPGGVALCVNAAGEAVNPAVANAATQVVAGVSKHQVDNTEGASGDLMVDMRTGVHKFDNVATANAVVPADVALRAKVYFVDNQTVSHTAADGCYGGRVVAIDADGGIWVDIAAND